MIENISDEERLQALRSLAVAEDEAADDGEDIPSNPFGSAFGAAAAAPLRKAEEQPVEVGEFRSRALADTATPMASGAEAAMSYPAELWSKPVQGPELPPAADKSDTPNYSEPTQPGPVAAATQSSEPDDDTPPMPSADARTSRPSADSAFDSERLRMLDAIASGDDEGRMRKAFEDDRRSAAEDRLSEALVGMARGAPVTFTTKMPSRAAEESALMSRKDKQNALRMQMMRGQGGTPDWYYRGLIEGRNKSNDIRELEIKERQLARAAADGDKAAQRELDRLKLDLQQKKLDVWSKYMSSKKGGAGGKSKAQLRAERDEALTALPGYSHDSKVGVKPEAVQQMRDTKGQVESIEGTIDDILSLGQQGGSAILPGEKRSQMQSLVRDLQLAMKGKAGYELGVLTGPDLDLLEEVIPNPSNEKGAFADFFTKGENTVAKLKTLRSQLRRRFDRRVAASGFSPEKQTASEPAGVAPVDSDKKTPSGKPYARRQFSASANKTRFLDDQDNVIEVVDGQK